MFPVCCNHCLLPLLCDEQICNERMITLNISFMFQSKGCCTALTQLFAWQANKSDQSSGIQRGKE